MASKSSDQVVPWVRLALLLTGVVTLFAIARTTTGKFVPADPTDALLFQSGLLVVVLSVSIVEQQFTKPAEALVNSLSALVAMIGVLPTAPVIPSATVIAYLAVVLAASIACILRQSSDRLARRDRSQDSRISYRISSELGRSRIVFSVVFLAAIVFYIDEPDTLTLSLVVFWGIFVALWPLRIPQLMSRLTLRSQDDDLLVGYVVRNDSPGIVRVELTTNVEWSWRVTPPVLVHLPDDSVRWAIPLISENRDDDRWGTAMLTGISVEGMKSRAGRVEASRPHVQAPSIETLLEAASGIQASELVGFVQEGSTVTTVRIEAIPGGGLRLGRLLVVGTQDGPVHYQVVNAETREEMFADLAYGSHVVIATQIGLLANGGEFERYEWVPSMNAPVFVVSDLPVLDLEDEPGLFTLGQIPGTEMALVGDFADRLTSHTAVLGVTGSGKTEFAFDLIRNAVLNDAKVICIDLTAQYSDRLNDLNPQSLSVSAALATTLGDKLFAVETGTYGAPDEKRDLGDFTSQLTSDISQRLHEFLEGDEQKFVIVELREISNSKATLKITELYLACLLDLARREGLREEVLVVVEEAHTVMPELNFIGSGDFDARGTVTRISQIALQGRKYGIGLLVIAQRTATVSKSVLTQCNTVISFSCMDETSVSFLANVYGRAVAEAVPQLKRLHAVAYGDWVRSEVPIAFEVKYDPEKAELSSFKPTQSESTSDGRSRDMNDDPPF